MKKVYQFILLAASILGITACDTGDQVASQGGAISFYKVPLVCGADPSIGCGSRAKPPLLEMEGNPAIKEAWLNRQGTVYAVVWKDKSQTDQVVKPIFAKYDIDFQEETRKEAARERESFRKEGQWYRGKEVDQLSLKEANTIANTYVGFSLDRKMISQGEAERIKPELETYFRNELVKVRTQEQLFKDAEFKFRQDAVIIFANVIGIDRTQKLLAMYVDYEKEQCRQIESCCTEDAAGKYCEKK